MTEDAGVGAGRGRNRLLALILGTAAASLAFRFALSSGWQHTAFVFVGVPTLLAVAVAMTPQAGTARGIILRSTTLALLLAAIVFGEAFVCILFAAPVIYLVAGGVGTWVDWSARKRHQREGFAHAPLLALLVLSVPALEGVVPRLEFPRDAQVSVARVVPASAAEVERTLAGPMRFEVPLPLFLRLGFPTPAETSGTGLRVGDLRAVAFAHGHHPGRLVMQVREAAPGRVEFAPVGDDSYLTHWLSWRSAEVRWRAVPGGTEVQWTLSYRRRLDPAWYFGPLERHGVGVAAGYLIDALATPRPGG